MVVIVVNYNDAITTIKFVNYIKDYDCVDKIVIVDNSSSDDSVIHLNHIVNEHIKLIVSSCNSGYAAGNNLGIKYAKEQWNPELICIANPDIIVEKNTIKKIADFIRKHSDAGIVSCIMIDGNGKEQVSAWKQPNFWDCILDGMFLVKQVWVKYNSYGGNGNEIKVDVIPGSFFICRLALLNAISYFDENTFLYYEENILSYKVKMKGKQNYLLGNLVYIHNHSITINKNIKSLCEKLKIAYKSRKIYCYNYLKIGKIQKIVLWLSYLVGTYSFVFAKKICKGSER